MSSEEEKAKVEAARQLRCIYVSQEDEDHEHIIDNARRELERPVAPCHAMCYHTRIHLLPIMREATLR